MKSANLWKAWSFVWERGKGWIVFSVAASLVLGFVPVATLWVSKELINAVAALIQNPGGAYGPALLLLVVQFLLTLFHSGLVHLQEYMSTRLQVKLDHDLQQVILKKTTSVPLAYFDAPDFFNHLTRINGSQGSRFLSPIRSLLAIGKEAVSVVSLAAYLFTVHWSLAVLSLAAAVPIFFVNEWIGNSKFFLMLMQTPLARDANYTSYLLSDRQSAKEIRLFGLAEHLMQRWSGKFLHNAMQSLRLLRRQQTASVGLDGLAGLLYLGSAGIIIWLIRTASLKIGDFVAIGQAVTSAQGSINQISTHVARMFEEGLYIRDFFHFLDYENPLLQVTRGTEPFPKRLETGIVLDRVCFSYAGSMRPILKDVSLRIRPGEKVAVVGENGSGKTTLVKCLMGLYPVSGGEIRFDDVPLQSIDVQDLHRHITVIFQDFMRFPYTARENIAFGDVARIDDLEAVREVAAATGVEEFVSRFPGGYETALGRFLTEGEELSGGQWQKVALARAMFRDGNILILDEPTAALDPQAEMEVFRQFALLTENKTAVFISHRMSAARMADRIVVMKDGRIVETGTHEELIALDGEYARMYEMQAQWFA